MILKLNAKKFADLRGKSHQEWLELRTAGIGGSDAAAIVGLNKYKKPLGVYMDKVEEVQEQEGNEFMYWGHTLESVVADEFKKRTGFKVQRSNFMWQHPEYEWMLANVDRFIYSDEGWGILEVKTASEYRNKDFEGDTIPEEYLIQIVHYMAVTGLNYGYLAVLVGGNKYKQFRVDRDEELVELLISEEKKFWFNHVQTGIPPELDGSDASTALLNILYPPVNVKEEEEILHLDEKAAELLAQYDTAKDLEAQYKEQKEEAANKLKNLIGDYQKAVWDERKISWKKIESYRFNRKAFEKENPEVAGKYLEKSVSRRFSVT
ncbi:YqaJ viral recombinase family protein [Bacillaceae bacterium C204]|uniref:YqaJ viral recombinase family nuclease n=1 Tax=Neobacillus sp. 204 TaxID=3383351 RepID=UPI003979FB2F